MCRRAAQTRAAAQVAASWFSSSTRTTSAIVGQAMTCPGSGVPGGTACPPTSSTRPVGSTPAAGPVRQYHRQFRLGGDRDGDQAGPVAEAELGERNSRPRSAELRHDPVLAAQVDFGLGLVRQDHSQEQGWEYLREIGQLIDAEIIE